MSSSAHAKQSEDSQEQFQEENNESWAAQQKLDCEHGHWAWPEQKWRKEDWRLYVAHDTR
jgi:hypothetical protein